jgi:DNA-binding MarR family transcriptional regulator
MRRLRRTETGYLLNKAARAWNARFVRALARRGITDIKPAFGAVLVPLFEEDGLRPGEIARRAGLSKQTMTTLVRPIEAAGYLDRRPDREDRRAVQLWLTQKARAVEPKIEAALEEIEREIAALAGPNGLAPVTGWLQALSEQAESERNKNERAPALAGAGDTA